MKTLIILILFAALIAVAHFTRPSERSFQTAITQNLQDRAAAEGSHKSIDTEAFLKDLTYKDRFLWVDVQRDGRTLYTGAFAHWFEHGQVLESPPEKTTLKLHTT